MWKCVGQAWYHPQRCLFPSSTALMDNSELLSPKFTFSFTDILGETWIAHIHSLKPPSKNWKADTQRSSVGMEKYDWLRKLYKKHRNHSANLFLPILYLVAITCLVWWNSRESVGKRYRSPPKGSYISLLYAPNVGSYHLKKKAINDILSQYQSTKILEMKMTRTNIPLTRRKSDRGSDM